MITLSNPEYLLLIFLIPVMFIAFGWMRRVRKKRISRFGDMDLVEQLTPTVSKRKGWVKLLFLSLALFFFAIGMSGPQIGATLKKKEVKGAEIMIVLDVSNSMLAQDYSPNRIERAKLAISKLVDELSQDRIGLIIFAGQSFVQLPVTSDYVSAKIFLNTIDTRSVPVQGTAAGEAIRTAIRSFTMDSENSRAIILITDGENHEDDPVAAAKDAAEMGAKVYCIGVGSPEGKPIPMADGLLKDKKGDIVVTRLNETVLRDIAEAGKGIYVRAGNTEFGLNPIIEEIRNLEAKEYQSVVFEEFDQQYMYFFGIALVFLLIELIISSTRNGRSFFNGVASGKDSSSAIGKGLSVIAVFLIISFSAEAQTDRKEVRAGNKHFKKGNYTEAEIEYKRALAADTSSAFAKYNLGNALYKNESFSESELYLKGLGDTLRSISSEKASDFYHNAGNLALKNKKYQEAVEAFKESLRLMPDNYETKSNLAYAQKMLRNQQQQQNQQQQNQQDQNQQDQNQQNRQEPDQDEKNQDQQQNQNQDNEDRSQQDQQSQQDAKITPQAAEQLLQAIADKEKETQEKVKKAEAEQQKKKQREKNW